MPTITIDRTHLTFRVGPTGKVISEPVDSFPAVTLSYLAALGFRTCLQNVYASKKELGWNGETIDQKVLEKLDELLKGYDGGSERTLDPVEREMREELAQMAVACRIGKISAMKAEATKDFDKLLQEVARITRGLQGIADDKHEAVVARIVAVLEEKAAKVVATRQNKIAIDLGDLAG